MVPNRAPCLSTPRRHVRMRGPAGNPHVLLHTTIPKPSPTLCGLENKILNLLIASLLPTWFYQPYFPLPSTAYTKTSQIRPPNTHEHYCDPDPWALIPNILLLVKPFPVPNILKSFQLKCLHSGNSWMLTGRVHLSLFCTSGSQFRSFRLKPKKNQNLKSLSPRIIRIFYNFALLQSSLTQTKRKGKSSLPWYWSGMIICKRIRLLDK